MSQLHSPSSLSQTTPGGPQAGGTRLVIIALVLALVAVVLVNVYISRVRAQVRQSTFIVYRLNRPIRAGDKLNVADVQPLSVPKSFAETFDKLGSLDEAALQVQTGNTFKVPAREGAILTHDLFIEPEDRDLQAEVTRGMRLVSLPVNDRTAPGNIKPGSFVDIEAAFLVGAGRPRVMSVLERARVVAVGNRSVAQEEQPGRPASYRSFKSITIEVSPQDATALSMIEKAMIGEFDLHLRNPGDTDYVKTPGGGVNPAVKDLVDKMSRQPAPLER